MSSWKITSFLFGAERTLPAPQAEVMKERSDIDQWTKGALTG